MNIKNRFRGFLPIIIDVETAGFDARKDALLELAAIPITIINNKFVQLEHFHDHILPFKNANLDKEALEFNKIDPFHPFRMAKDETKVMVSLDEFINNHLKNQGCKKAILVGHNAWFDLSFINAANKRAKVSSNLHSFSSIDTATLGAIFYGHTVLAKILNRAKIKFDPEKAHGALYDTSKTAELFCNILNEKADNNKF
jgi:ribonuclease T